MQTPLVLNVFVSDLERGETNRERGIGSQSFLCWLIAVKENRDEVS